MAIPYVGPPGDTYFEILKIRKFTIPWFNKVGNHPNRLASISMSGDTTFDRDGRISETGLSTTRTLVEIDYSLLPTWDRIIRSKIPLLLAQTGFGTGQFGLFSDANSIWTVSQIKGSTPSGVVVGTTTEFVYSRAVNTDPWTEDSAIATDYTLSWSPILSGGGVPASGGKGADNDTNSIEITAIPGPYFGSITIYRLPWDQAWTNETTLLSDAFDDYLAAEIAAHPSTAADYSGSCTAEVVFGY